MFTGGSASGMEVGALILVVDPVKELYRSRIGVIGAMMRTAWIDTLSGARLGWKDGSGA